MFKRFIRNKFVIWCLSWVVAGIIASIMITTRWKTVNRQLADQILNNHNGFVLILWHERIFAVPWLWPRRHPMYVLQSPHADGQLMSYTVNRMGIRTVWGSSNRNAISGLRGLKRVLDRGQIATITPDGPRGPARKLAVGPVALAAMAGKPVVPICWAVDRYWRAPGWDGTIIPKPFARGRFIWGDPIEVPKGDRDAMETSRLKIEAAMNDLADRADRLFAEEDGQR